MLFHVAKFVMVFVDAVGKPEIYYTSKLSLADESNVKVYIFQTSLAMYFAFFS